MPTINLSPAAILAISALSASLWVIAVIGFHLYSKDKKVNIEADLKPKKQKKDEEFILYKITRLIGKPFKPLVLSLLGEDGSRSVRRRLDAAGRPGDITLELYAERKAGEVLLFGGLGFVFIMGGSFVYGMLALLFTTMTDLDLYSRAKKRQDKIQEQLPDFLDVLAVTVGAGLSFRQALERVSKAMPGVLSDEIATALRQMDLGTSRKQAFEALATRNSNDSLGKFVTAIQQAEELGAPLGTALNEISMDMRRDDAQYMRRKAQKLNPQVTGISAATLLPALILLIGGTMFFGMAPDLGMFGG